MAPGVTQTVGQGVPGQNNNNPLSIFKAHCLVFYNNKYYDPSYGVIYNDIADIEARAIDGYVKQVVINELQVTNAWRKEGLIKAVEFFDPNSNGLLDPAYNIFLFRQKKPGQLGIQRR